MRVSLCSVVALWLQPSINSIFYFFFPGFKLWNKEAAACFMPSLAEKCCCTFYVPFMWNVAFIDMTLNVSDKSFLSDSSQLSLFQRHRCGCSCKSEQIKTAITINLKFRMILKVYTVRRWSYRISRADLDIKTSVRYFLYSLTCRSPLIFTILNGLWNVFLIFFLGAAAEKHVESPHVTSDIK